MCSDMRKVLISYPIAMTSDLALYVCTKSNFYPLPLRK
jgi:hypothetical protein